MKLSELKILFSKISGEYKYSSKTKLERVRVRGYLYHVSNLRNRDEILSYGLVPNIGVRAKGYYPLRTPAIFLTNSNKVEDLFDTTVDDDVWQINTNGLNNKFYKDPWFNQFDEGYYHVITFDPIPAEHLKLVYEGTGADLLYTEDAREHFAEGGDPRLDKLKKLKLNISNPVRKNLDYGEVSKSEISGGGVDSEIKLGTESPSIEVLIKTSHGYVKLGINGVIYEYEFPAGATFDMLWEKYGRNKGRFLNKIRPYMTRRVDNEEIVTAKLYKDSVELVGTPTPAIETKDGVTIDIAGKYGWLDKKQINQFVNLYIKGVFDIDGYSFDDLTRQSQEDLREFLSFERESKKQEKFTLQLASSTDLKRAMEEIKKLVYNKPSFQIVGNSFVFDTEDSLQDIKTLLQKGGVMGLEKRGAVEWSGKYPPYECEVWRSGGYFRWGVWITNGLWVASGYEDTFEEGKQKCIAVLHELYRTNGNPSDEFLKKIRSGLEKK